MTTTTDLPASPLKDFLTGALHMTPLNLAVVPWAILAGSMAVDSGLTFAQSVAMSAMVFAGAAQLVTLGLLNSGAGVITIIVSVFFITSQHLLYGLTLRPHVRPFSPLQRAGIGFLLTDELFACWAPADGAIPKLKTAGKIMIPARTATKVLMIVTCQAVANMLVSFPK